MKLLSLPSGAMIGRFDSREYDTVEETLEKFCSECLFKNNRRCTKNVSAYEDFQNYEINVMCKSFYLKDFDCKNYNHIQPIIRFSF